MSCFSRSSNNSFLRRGATSHSSLRHKTHSSSQINLWCPSQQRLPLSSPSTPVKSSDYSMPRCRSENLMGDTTTKRLSPSKPILMGSAERLEAADNGPRKSPSPSRHVSWSAATSTIRATYRFSHGRPSTAPPPRVTGGSVSAYHSPSSPIHHRAQTQATARAVIP